MTDKDLQNIRQMAEEHRTTPRPEAWERVASHLGHQETKRKVGYYQKLSIAAAFIAVLSVSVLFNQYWEKRNPDVFASNEDYKPLVIEDLEDNTDFAIYSVAKVNTLYGMLNKK